jgi:hypothetical protein
VRLERTIIVRKECVLRDLGSLCAQANAAGSARRKRKCLAHLD